MTLSRLKNAARARCASLLAVAFFAGHAQAADLGCAANGITATFGVHYGNSLPANETWHLIDGDPVKFAVGSNGGVAAWVCQPNGVVRQYYAEYAWGSVLWLSPDGAAAGASQYQQGFGIPGFTSVSHTMTDPWSVETVLAAGDAQIRQIISYTDGDLYVKKRWEITNTGESGYEDARFFHGGDTYFGGYDSARSWWDPQLGMAYVNNANFSVSGIMGFYANPATPADHYFGGFYYTGYEEARTGQLSDTANSAYVDAGYQLQWNRAVLEPGATWVIEAFETWTQPSAVQVIAPADVNTPAGNALVQEFKLHNLHTVESHTVSLTALNSLGWAVSFPEGAQVGSSRACCVQLMPSR